MTIVIRNKISFMVTILLTLLVMAGVFPGKTAASATSDWPAQNVTIAVAYGPGGGYDLVARAIAPFIEKYLPKRVAVIVKNIPGGGSRIGTRELVKSKPDGLTIGMFDPVTVALMEVGGELEWLDTKKLSWLVGLDYMQDMLLVGPKTGFKTPRDMKGRTVRFAAQDDAHIIRTALTARSIGATPQFVRYNSTGESTLAMLRGDLDATCLSWSSGMVQAKSSDNKIIPLLVSSRTRVPGLNVPCAQEFGIEVDEIIMDHPHMLAAPPGLPPELRRMWEDVFAKVFKDQGWFDTMGKLGFPAVPMIGNDKMDSYVAVVMERMGKYKDILSSLSLLK